MALTRNLPRNLGEVSVSPFLGGTMAKQERIGDWLVHPAASLFPLLEGEQYEQLKASIRVHGLKESIVVKDGVLWDGRNRGKACLELGIDPPTVVYTGSLSAEQYIIDANILRRNLTDDQRLALYSM